MVELLGRGAHPLSGWPFSVVGPRAGLPLVQAAAGPRPARHAALEVLEQVGPVIRRMDRKDGRAALAALSNAAASEAAADEAKPQGYLHQYLPGRGK